MQRHVSITNIVDWPTIIVYIILVLAGWATIYAASYNFDSPSMFDFSQRAGKQLLWIACAAVIGILLLLVNSRFYDGFAYVIYVGMVLLLIATIFLAHDIKGSRSWLVIGPISIQPAELAKFATSLALAKLMSEYNFRLEGFRNYARAVLIILLPAMLIILQKETGSALAFVALFLVLYRKGMPGVLLVLGVIAVALFIFVIKYGTVFCQSGEAGCVGMIISLSVILVSSCVFIIVFLKDRASVWNIFKVVASVVAVALLVNLFVVVDYVWFGYALIAYLFGYTFWKAFKSGTKGYMLVGLFALVSVSYCLSADYLFDNVLQAHQQSRIRVLLGTEEDPTGAGYNVNQSKIAIGSGQVIGKGYLKGTQTKLNYVPEQDTDFIFCTVGEEFGFVGSVFILSLYLYLMIRIVNIAERQTEVFNQVYAYCVASIFFFHFMINIGMVLGVMPVIGIPLPFFSYGGSSLWGFTILLFVLLKLDSTRLER